MRPTAFQMEGGGRSFYTIEAAKITFRKIIRKFNNFAQDLGERRRIFSTKDMHKLYKSYATVLLKPWLTLSFSSFL